MKTVKKFLAKYYYSNYRFKSPKVLGRVACLGTDVITLLGLDAGFVNHQKSRIDYLLELDLNNKIKPQSEKIFNHLDKKHIYGCIQQQERNFFSYKKPDYIFIDSFSELTDQLFVNNFNDRQFLANYSDIKHDKVFSKEYICAGLLKTESLYNSYKAFFLKISKSYPGVPIFFIHFPTTLDNRAVFKERGRIIFDAINTISKTNNLIYSIQVDDDDVIYSEDENDDLKGFPYHYGKATYQKFIDKIKAVMIEKKYEVS